MQNIKRKSGKLRLKCKSNKLDFKYRYYLNNSNSNLRETF